MHLWKEMFLFCVLTYNILFALINVSLCLFIHLLTCFIHVVQGGQASQQSTAELNFTVTNCPVICFKKPLAVCLCRLIFN